MYAVSLQLYEPTRVAIVADRADVSKETAREYLRWFTEIGMLTHDGESPDQFSRNESYFEWRRIQRLQAHPPEKLEEELEQLTATERDYRDRYDADGPGEVDALEHADYTDLESVWMELQEWQTVRRRIRELEQARQNQNGSAQAPA
nr:ArsR family transcriptional regulator [Natronosalvus vescus]